MGVFKRTNYSEIGQNASAGEVLQELLKEKSETCRIHRIKMRRRC